MTTCSMLRRTREHLTLAIGDKACRLTPSTTIAFERAMDLKGLSHQELFDRMMASKWDRPWRVMERLGRRLMRQRTLQDNTLGPLHITRNYADELQAYRHKGKGRCSTSFTAAPFEWRERYAHVKAGDVHDEDGIYLYTLDAKDPSRSYDAYLRRLEAA